MTATLVRDAERELEARAVECLKAYPLRGQAQVRLIRDAVNRTYRVEAGDGIYAFREYRPSVYGVERIRSEVAWLEALKGEPGLHLAQPVRTNDGEAAVLIPGEPPWRGSLFHWLEGEAGDPSLSVEAVEEMGAVLGRLHRHGRSFQVPTGFDRPRFDLDGLLGNNGGPNPFLGISQLSPSDRSTLEEASAFLRLRIGELPVGTGTFGLVHGDLTPQNVLIRGDQLGVVDFADAGFGYFLYDIATSLLRFRERPDYRSVQQALLRGYRREMALDPAHEIFLESFQAARQIYLLSWLCRHVELEEVAEGAADGFPFIVSQVRQFLDRHRRSSAPGGDGPAPQKAKTTVQLLASLQAAGIDLWAEEGRLRFSAPKGALTSDLKQEIKSRREELIRFLSRAAAPKTSEPEGIPKAETSGPTPLSFAQERLWFFDQLEPESSAYNLSPAFRLRGELQVSILEAALKTVVERHAVLRTRYERIDGRPHQWIVEDAEVTLPLVDLEGLEASATEVEVRRALDLGAQRPFHLDEAPVLRAALFRLGPSDQVLLFVVHHIAFDGWSSSVMMGELLMAYRSLVAGEPLGLPPLAIQYADFAVWQRQWLQGAVLEEQLDFWRQHLEGAPTLLELPTDRPRGPAQGNDGAKLLRWFSPHVTESVRTHCRGRDLTPFMILVSTFALVLGRWTGRRDVLVGSPIANRNRPELEGLVGFFANTLVFRTVAKEGITGEELWNHAREGSVGAYGHQDLPFERLVEELQPQRDPLHPPLVQVLFALENVATPSVAKAEIDVETIQADSGSVPFELIALMREEEGRLRLSLRYRRALFDGTTMARLASQVETLVARLLADPQRSLDEVSTLPAAQAHQLLVELPGHGTPFPGDRTVDELFVETATQSPENPALLYGDETVTYQQLDARSLRWASSLQALGIGPEGLVGVALERSPELIVAFLSILRAGGAYLPLDAAYPDERIAFMLEDTAASVVLVDASTRSRLAALTEGQPTSCRPRLVDVTTGELEDRAAPLAGGATPDNLAYVIYTSGSTGRPKGVAIPHRAIVRLVRDASYLPVVPSDRFGQISNASFDAATYEIWGALLNGAGLVGLDRSTVLSPDALATALSRFGITHLFLTVALFNQVASLTPNAFASCRQVLAGGEAVDPSAMEAVLKAGAPAMLGNGYGPTESTTFAAVHRVTLPVPGSVPLGRAISNTSLWVASRQGRPVPMGAFGELLIGGHGLGRGYLHRSALTAQSFIPDSLSGESGARLYRTGDLVRWRGEGVVEFAGRLDHQIKLRGFRIELGEIETALSSLPGISGAVARVVGEGAGNRRLVAYLQCPGGTLTPERARELAAQQLAEYMVPSTFVVMDTLPLTPNGKVDRKALRDPEPVAALDQSFDSPEEELLAGIWAEVLQRSAIGRDDDFFEVGGHSLMATQIASRVREVFGVEMPLAWMFESSTVGALAPRVAELQRGPESSVVPPLEASQNPGPAPLSYAQQRLWFLDQLEAGTATYNMPAPVLLRGQVDGRALEQALHQLVERQQGLATIFPLREGDPIQEIQLGGYDVLPRLDLRGLDGAIGSQEARRLVERDASRPFDLAKGPLLRAALIRVRSEEHLLLLCLHHIVSDGWSMGILLRELAALYGAAASGEASRLAPLPLQYADFSRWQRGWLQGEVLERELDFWREQLEGAPALLELPTDRPRPAIQTHRGDTRRFSLGPELSQALDRLSRQQGATLFMVALATFSVLLSRLGGGREIVVGSPIAGRNRRETEGLIGFFVNTLALRTTVEGTFEELLREVRQRTLQAYAHQDVPFERLVEKLQPHRDLSATPIFQVMLVLQNAPGGQLEAPGVVLEPVVLRSDTAKFDLSLSLQEGAEGLRGGLEFNRDLFDGSTVERWAGAYRTLLDDAVRSFEEQEPRRSVTELAMLTLGQRHQLTAEWSFRGAPKAVDVLEGGIHDLFLRRAGETPASVALLDGEEEWTYGALEELSAQIARRLLELGVGVEDRVGILMQRRGTLVAALLGVLRAGGAYVPLDPAYPTDRLAFMLEDSGAQVVLTDTASKDRLPEGPSRESLKVELVSRELSFSPRTEASSSLDALMDRAVEPKRLAYVIYTSGSTGRPKGVAIEHRSALALLNWAGEVFSENELDGVLAATSVCFDLSIFEIFLPLARGGTVILADNALALPHLPGADRVRLVNTVPSAAMELVRGGSLPTGVRTVNLAGEPLKRHLVNEILAQGPGSRVLNLYGPSEDTTYSTFTVVPDGDGEPTIGRTLTGTTATVVDSRGCLVPLGTSGELWLAGDGLARGYLGRPGLTAQAFVPNPFGEPGARAYRTGDLVRHLGDGQLSFLGRLDHQVKIRGFRIELGEIETALLAQDGVGRAVAVAPRTGPGAGTVVAYVEGNSPRAELDGRILRDSLRHALPEVMVPAFILVLDALPLTPNGKIDRKSLPSPEASLTTDAVLVEARTPDEEILQGIWQEVLEIPEPSVTTSFFDLGGHSLVATQVTSRVRRIFGLEIPVRLLFEAPTIQAFARRMREGRQAGGAPPLVPSDREGTAPLSFAQQRLWLLEQMGNAGTAYNMPLAFRLDGPFEVRAFGLALDRIIERHESLRTVFVTVAGEPRQRVMPERKKLLANFLDLGALPDTAQEAAVSALARQEAARGFSLEEGPLLRCRILRLAAERHVVLLTLHHIVADGWSLGVLLREIGELYGGMEDGLPELPVQYRDFSVWQRHWLQGSVLEAEVEHWRLALEGAPARIELPTDRPRPPVVGYQGDSHPLKVPASLATSFTDLVRRQEGTRFMGLLAIVGGWLAQLSGQRDVVIGTPIAGRNRGETEGLIGFFVNSLALRLRMEKEASFLDLLSLSRESSLQAYEHQDLPFERIVEELDPPRDPGTQPLFQVLLALQNAPAGGEGLPGLAMRSLETSGTTAKFDLSVILGDEGDGIGGSLEFRTDLFDVTTIERWKGHLLRMMERAVEAPEAPLSQGSWGSLAQQHQLLVEWPGFSTPFPGHRSVPALFLEMAESNPEAVALLFGEDEISYGQLEIISGQWAGRLQDLGVGRESLVGVSLAPSWQRVVAFLAILRAGGAYLPLDASYPDERLAFMLEDAEASVVLVDASTADRLTSLGTSLPGTRSSRLIDVEELGGISLSEITFSGPGPALPESLAYVIYTSGSTGRPKGVAISHRAIVRLVREAGYLSVQPSDRFAQLSNASFDAATYEIWGALLNGASLVGFDRSEVLSPVSLAEGFQRLGVTQVFLTVALFNQFAHQAPKAFGAMKDVLTGGEAVDAQAMATVLEAAPPERLCNIYGPTESTTYATYYPVAQPSGNVPIGRPIANTTLWVLDDELRSVPLGAVGELWIGGAGLARGYLGRPSLTAERFVPDPWSGEVGGRFYRTGDLVRWLPTGDVQFLRRLDNQVKLRGFRIELGEVETALTVLPSVDAAVAVILGTGDGRRLVAYVVVGDAGMHSADLKGQLAQRLPEYLVPSSIVVLEELPLTPNGKVDRRALPEPLLPTDEAEGGFSSPVEELVAGIFAEVLGVETVGRDGDFFEMGGHSLLATQVTARMRSIFGVEVPLARVFESPTTASLAAWLSRHQGGGEEPIAPPLVPTTTTEDPPLSFAQQRLWFLHQLDPSSAAYNVPAVLRLGGALNVARLHGALDTVEARHEALRTHFPEGDGGMTVQRVPPHRTRPLPTVDLSALSRSVREVLSRELVRREGGKGFDLASGPVLRRRLLRMDREEHILLLTVHHIVADGWSLGILVRELGALYEGTPNAVPRLAVQYGDFARWQRGWLQGEVLEAELSFWKEQLAGAPNRLELPTDRPRPMVQSPRGSTYGFTLPTLTSEGLDRLGRDRGATLFMVLLTTFQVLLGRMSGQRDVVVGTPVAGRSHREVEDLIGFFVNTLALRTRLQGPFEAVLNEVRRTVLATFAHQEVPFERLVEELRPERDTSVPPIFQVSFALQNVPRSDLKASDLVIEPISAPSETAKFDLTLAMEERDDGLHGALEINRDLFDETTALRLISSFHTLLGEILETPGREVENLLLLTSAQKHQLIEEWNDTAEEYGPASTVPEGVLAQARRTPEATAVVFDDGVVHEEVALRYRELVAWATAEAQSLRRKGIQPGAVVAVCLDRSLEQVVALLAVSLAGAAYLPLDPSYPKERLAYLLKDGLGGQPVRIVVTGRGPSLVEGSAFGGASVEVHRIGAPPDETTDDLSAPSPLSPAYVLYTSGSTGRPKGAVISHRALANHMQWILRALCLGPDDSVLQKTPMSFDASVWEYWAPLLSGGRLILAKPEGHRDPTYLLEAVKRHSITVFQAVPSLWRALLDDGGLAGCASLRWLASGGEALTPSLARELLKQGSSQVINLYGPTEATIDATSWTVEELPVGQGSPIGRPISNLFARVLDEAGHALPVGAFGELCLAGAGLAQGYHRRPGLTASQFVPDPFASAPGGRLYRTGDRSRWRPDGELEVVGRLDDQVKIRGFRIEVGEVEAALASLSGVQQAAVLAQKESGAPARLVAAIVLEAADNVFDEDPQADFLLNLRSQLVERLPGHLIPSAFAFLEELPKSPSGKVDRRRLGQQHFGAGSSEGTKTAPRSETEKVLYRIWTDLLGAPPAGVESSFFDLGGHSLLAVQLVSRIRRETGRRIPLAALFQAPTLESQAELIHHRGEVVGREPLVRLRSGEGTPLVLVHPVGGNLLCYRSLVDRLPESLPVLGLQAPTTEDGEPLLADVEAIARIYLEALRKQVSRGPYRLAGWSFGGLVAFEMARRLKEIGEDCDLVLLDAVPSSAVFASKVSSSEEDLSESHILRHFVADLAGLLGETGGEALDLENGLAGVHQQARERGLRLQGLDLADLEELYRLFRAGFQAWGKYRPKSLDGGQMTLVMASEGARGEVSEPNLGWAPESADKLTVEIVPGDHFSFLQTEAGLDALAEILVKGRS